MLVPIYLNLGRVADINSSYAVASTLIQADLGMAMPVSAIDSLATIVAGVLTWLVYRYVASSSYLEPGSTWTRLGPSAS